jgi:phosphatidate cytidylyltransferase
MLLKRILTAAILLPLFIGGLFFLQQFWWGIGLLPLVIAGAWEWATLAGFGLLGRWSFCALMLATIAALLLTELPVSLAGVDHAIFAASAIFWLIVVPPWLKNGWQVRSVGMLIATGWLLLVPTWLALVRLQEQPWVLLAMLGVVWIADSAAYFAGHQWGRRKLAPAISPGKTWEGVAGAAVAVAVYHAAVWKFGFGPAAPGLGVAAAVLVAVLFPLSIIGDLFESWIKRQAGVKDSGRLLPGHGGVLDRIDALTSTLPLAALVFSWMMQRV